MIPHCSMTLGSFRTIPSTPCRSSIVILKRVRMNVSPGDVRKLTKGWTPSVNPQDTIVSFSRSTTPSYTLLPLPIHTTSAKRFGFGAVLGFSNHAIISFLRGSHSDTALKWTSGCSLRIMATAFSISTSERGSSGWGGAVCPVTCEASCLTRSSTILVCCLDFKGSGEGSRPSQTGQQTRKGV